MVEDSKPSAATAPQEETTQLMAYRELAYQESQRLYEFAVLMVEDPDLAIELLRRALDRTWTAVRGRQIYMDIDEATYWNLCREATRRLARSKELRGYQPPTTSSDRHITAVGLLDGFSPEQRAAIFLAARFDTGYQFAGAGAGIGEARARDVIFAARQEYRSARERWEPLSADCSRLAPLLSAKADSQIRDADRAEVDAHVAHCSVCARTEALYQDFSAALKELRLPLAGIDLVEDALTIPAGRPDEKPSPWRRMLTWFGGPLALIPLFVVGFFVFRQCEPPPVETGVGRTSDIVFARATDGQSILVLESGSGRELSRLPAGLLAPNGHGVYGESARCTAANCQTMIQRTDTATGETSSVANLAGKLRLVAVDGEAAYLADEDAGWNELVAVSLRDGTRQGAVSAPTGVNEAFGPRRSVVDPTRGKLFTLARSAESQGLVVLTTDLAKREITSSVPLQGAAELGAEMTRSADGNHLFVYSPEGPTVIDLKVGQNQPPTVLKLAGVPGSAALPADGTLIAEDPRGEFLYVVLPSAGVAVLRQTPLELVTELATDRRYRAIGVSSDGGSLYTLGFDGAYRVLDAASGAQRANRGQLRAVDIIQVTPGE